MHMGVQRKYVSELTDTRRASSGEGHSPTRLCILMQGKYAAKAVHSAWYQRVFAEIQK